MHCARCGSFADETADFCTECGAQLRPVGGDADPIQVGAGSAAVPTAAPDPEFEAITAPIRGIDEPPADSGTAPDPSPQRGTAGQVPEEAPPLVSEMAAADKEAWLDEIWGLPDDRDVAPPALD